MFYRKGECRSYASLKILCILLLIGCWMPSYQSSAQQRDDAPKDTSALLQAGKTRDSLAAAEALNTWWTESMRDHDERIAWWRHARFGCFIHWGVYSGPGGVWKGEPVYGYAEHLMRIKKIPLETYKKEVVAKFDPAYFDADQWVKKIKYAGMRYLIITAKHHDGFAMYNSDVNDYNVVKATPWHHDPMKDLAVACKKYGIKFGFYYSHAFDWEDPTAPGNDWDYNNPGGDKQLFGGLDWYNLHPEMLKRILQYVNGKALPQIKELIHKYHPDILWFDSPHKLPFSVNLHILHEIRKIDTTVVINGRLAHNASMNFGDYQNTADRPKEFFPVKGDWEAIPTTNESYGYNQTDTVHKPASFFIRLLAKAVSRGGNMLMNIGPMGNGRIDPKDTTILYAMGEWMRVNSASIYGTTATPLPLQPWGVSALKEHTLYLHVFHWPKDGQLIVGGLKSDVSGAYLLKDARKKPLQVKRINEHDITIALPRQAPDTINTVIALKIKGSIRTDSIRLITADMPNRLLVFDSRLHGDGLLYSDGKATRYYVYQWQKPDQWMSWQFRADRAAKYHVTIKYETDSRNKGSVYSIGVAGHTIEKKVKVPEKGSRIYTEDLGTISIPQGSHNMTIKAVSIPGDEVMKLFQIDLIPVK